MISNRNENKNKNNLKLINENFQNWLLNEQEEETKEETKTEPETKEDLMKQMTTLNKQVKHHTHRVREAIETLLKKDKNGKPYWFQSKAIAAYDEIINSKNLRKDSGKNRFVQRDVMTDDENMNNIIKLIGQIARGPGNALKRLFKNELNKNNRLRFGMMLGMHGLAKILDWRHSDAGEAAAITYVYANNEEYEKLIKLEYPNDKEAWRKVGNRLVNAEKVRRIPIRVRELFAYRHFSEPAEIIGRRMNDLINTEIERGKVTSRLVRVTNSSNDKPTPKDADKSAAAKDAQAKKIELFKAYWDAYTESGSEEKADPKLDALYDALDEDQKKLWLDDDYLVNWNSYEEALKDFKSKILDSGVAAKAKASSSSQSTIRKGQIDRRRTRIARQNVKTNKPIEAIQTALHRAGFSAIESKPKAAVKESIVGHNFKSITNNWTSWLLSEQENNKAAALPGVDGKYGKFTIAAVKKFQTYIRQKVPGAKLGSTGPNKDGVDGTVGPLTWAYLQQWMPGGEGEIGARKVAKQIAMGKKPEQAAAAVAKSSSTAGAASAATDTATTATAAGAQANPAAKTAYEKAVKVVETGPKGFLGEIHAMIKQAAVNIEGKDTFEEIIKFSQSVKVQIGKQMQLPLWNDVRFWEAYINRNVKQIKALIKTSSDKSNHSKIFPVAGFLKQRNDINTTKALLKKYAGEILSWKQALELVLKHEKKPVEEPTKVPNVDNLPKELKGLFKSGGLEPKKKYETNQFVITVVDANRSKGVLEGGPWVRLDGVLKNKDKTKMSSDVFNKYAGENDPGGSAESIVLNHIQSMIRNYKEEKAREQRDGTAQK